MNIFNHMSKFVNIKKLNKQIFIFDTPSVASQMKEDRKKRSPKKNKIYKSEE